MNISGLHNQNLQQIYKKQIDRTAATDAIASKSSTGQRDEGDLVELSTNARLLQKVLLEIRNGQDTAPERLSSLRKQVQEDSYDVSLQKLADRLFAEVF